MNSVITGGMFRGRKIASPNSQATHPMGARERLALFNAIGAKRGFLGAKVLDAYAGTGALGLEALSRGAKEVTFIENNRKALECLRNNIKEFEVVGNSKIVERNVVLFEADEKFEIIFVDPPYNNWRIEDFRHLKDSLANGGMLMISHPLDKEVVIDGLQLISDKSYAGAGIAIFELLPI